MLSLQGVSKTFKAGNYGVRELSLTLDGGVLGLLGPNGAGKTTLMQVIATVTRPTEGEIRFQGEDTVRRPEALRPRLGYLPQDFGTYGNLSADEHLTYFAALKGVHSRSRIAEMLERVNLHTVGRRLVGDFSGGMKQRLRAVLWIECLTRFRRPSTLVLFLLLSWVAYLWVPDPSTGMALLVIDGQRALYFLTMALAVEKRRISHL